jgi:hypothetical protein
MIKFAKTACLAALLLAAGCATTPSAPTASIPPAPPGQSQAAPLGKLYTQLANPGFESWKAADCPDGWVCVQHVGEPSYRFTPDKATKTEGANSLRIEKIATQPFGAATQYHYLPKRLQTMTLRLSGKVKVSDLAGEGAGLMLIIDGAMGQSVKTQTKFLKGTADWEAVEVTGQVAPGSTAIRVQAVLEAEKGTAWFDDIKLEQLP